MSNEITIGNRSEAPDPKIEEAFNHGIASVIYSRCAKHYQVPQQNKNEHSGHECGGCMAEERDWYKLQYEAIKIEINQRLDELESLRTRLRMTDYTRKPE